MSYDLIISSKRPCGQRVSLGRVISLIESECSFNGKAPGFYYDDKEEGIYFEIDLSLVDSDGEIIDAAGNGMINQIEIHVPGANFERSISMAEEVAASLARRLTWQVYDEQKISSEGIELESWKVFPGSKRFMHLLIILIGGSALVGLTIYLIAHYIIGPM